VFFTATVRRSAINKKNWHYNGILITKHAVMVVVKNKKPADAEKEWNNPVEPAKSFDERDKEQLLRQYKEAKRRKDNLSNNDEDNKTNLNERL
jgi:hypothetical protein